MVTFCAREATRIRNAVAIGTSALLVSSCANFNTINRTNPLPGTSTSVTVVKDSADGKSRTYDVKTSASHGTAIHLDAPQRLAYVNAIGQLCAEPSPDAIQAYAASLGASITVPGKAADIAAALSASTGGIGLRTQAITLMRDHLYRLCEAYHNKAMTPDVVQMLQRSQDLTLGVLAIEQLTGTVVARQPMLTPEASAAAARNMLGKSVEALEQAKKTETAKKAAAAEKKGARDKLQATVEQDTEEDKAAKATAKPVQDSITGLEAKVKTEEANLKQPDANFKAAKAKQDKQAAKVAEIQKALDAATGKKDQPEIDKQTALLAAEKALLAKDDEALAQAKAAYDTQKAVLDPLVASLKQAKADPVLTAAKEAADKLKKDKDALTAAEAALKEAETDYKDAQSITAVRRAELDNGAAAVDAVTKSGGLFSPAADRNNIDKDTVAAIAEATTKIVDNVLNKGHVVDGCLNVLSAHAREEAKPSPEFIALCIDAVSTYVEDVAAYNRRVREENETVKALELAPVTKDKGAKAGNAAAATAAIERQPRRTLSAPKKY